MKVLQVKADKCIGCRTCEVACSYAHHGKNNPFIANVKVVPAEKEGTMKPTICRQCPNAKCMEACSVGAISRNAENTVLVDKDKCVGCGACVKACPFSAIHIDFELKKAHKCDLCGGDPMCVKLCPTGALVYGDPKAKEGN